MDEGRGLQMRAGTQRRRVGHVGGGWYASVRRGHKGGGLVCMGGQCAWEGGMHGRAARMGGWHTWEGSVHRRAVGMGGQQAWEGSRHGRRAAHISGGWCVKVRAETHGRGLSCVGGGPCHADGGHEAWKAQQGAQDAWVRVGTHEGFGTWVDG